MQTMSMTVLELEKALRMQHCPPPHDPLSLKLKHSALALAMPVNGEGKMDFVGRVMREERAEREAGNWE